MNVNFFWVICISLLTLIQSSAGPSLIPEGRLSYSRRDTSLAINTISQFLKWYKINYSRIHATGLSYTNAGGNYEVDTSACHSYLNKLMSSGFFSHNYQKLWEDYFISKANWWKENPQNEGPPEGFDYDLVLLTQEPELFYNQPDALQYEVVEFSEQLAVIAVKADWTLYFEMTLEKGKWKIDYISGEGFD